MTLIFIEDLGLLLRFEIAVFVTLHFDGNNNNNNRQALL